LIYLVEKSTWRDISQNSKENLTFLSFLNIFFVKLQKFHMQNNILYTIIIFFIISFDKNWEQNYFFVKLFTVFFVIPGLNTFFIQERERKFLKFGFRPQ
jgi:hypothetical protein